MDVRRRDGQRVRMCCALRQVIAWAMVFETRMLLCVLLTLWSLSLSARRMPMPACWNLAALAQSSDADCRPSYFPDAQVVVESLEDV